MAGRYSGCSVAVLTAGEPDLPFVWHPCQLVVVGTVAGHVAVAWSTQMYWSPVLAWMDGHDDGVAVSCVDEFDVFAGAGGPTQTGFDAVPVDAGDRRPSRDVDVQVAGSWPELGLELARVSPPVLSP